MNQPFEPPTMRSHSTMRGRSDVRCDTCGCDDAVVLTVPLGPARLRHQSVAYCVRHDTISEIACSA